MAVGHLLCINTILATIEIYMAPIWAEDWSRQELGKVAETYKVRSEKCRKFFLGIEKKAGQMQKVGAFT